MFAAAYEIASSFTRPVIISRRHADGSCDSGVGTFVIVNNDGWILTAAHILQEGQKLRVSKGQFDQHQQAKAAIENDTSLMHSQKKKKLRSLGHVDPKWIVNYSFWWAADNVNVVDWHTLLGFAGDIAVGRLETFDAAKVTCYPQFKDPNKPIPPGTSLCRLGFPFHQIQPTYDGAKFQLPAGTFPMVFFPNEGILSRVLVTDQDPNNFAAFIETSSPGLPGQSGGPLFDKHGTVWGIQSHTSSLPLGFSPSPPGAKAGEVEHQFLNVGRATHPMTISLLLNQAGAKHAVASY